MTKKIIIWSVVVVAIIGGTFGMIKLSQNSGSQTASIAPINGNDWVYGPEKAKVELIEYSDFQCPACAAYFPVVKQLKEDFKDNLKFSYRHYPLRQIHFNAELAARASEAAGAQGKFWEMHDALFQTQDFWSSRGDVRAVFIEIADNLELDTEKFAQDMDSEETIKKVGENYLSGLRAGVNATPTFFLNREKIQNPRSYEDFSALILEEISKAADIEESPPEQN